jgi:hypothetical protein
MKSYTFYTPETGIISFSVNCNEELLGTILETSADSYIEGDFPREFYYIDNGNPVAIPDIPVNYIFNYNTKQVELDLVTAKVKVLNIRQQLLEGSDWTDTVSAQTRLGETLYNSWQTYRQELRDITLQAGYPLEVVFPSPPQ